MEIERASDELEEKVEYLVRSMLPRTLQRSSLEVQNCLQYALRLLGMTKRTIICNRHLIEQELISSRNDANQKNRMKTLLRNLHSKKSIKRHGEILYVFTKIKPKETQIESEESFPSFFYSGVSDTGFQVETSQRQNELVGFEGRGRRGFDENPEMELDGLQKGHSGRSLDFRRGFEEKRRKEQRELVQEILKWFMDSSIKESKMIKWNSREKKHSLKSELVQSMKCSVASIVNEVFEIFLLFQRTREYPEKPLFNLAGSLSSEIVEEKGSILSKSDEFFSNKCLLEEVLGIFHSDFLNFCQELSRKAESTSIKQLYFCFLAQKELLIETNILIEFTEANRTEELLEFLRKRVSVPGAAFKYQWTLFLKLLRKFFDNLAFSIKQLTTFDSNEVHLSSQKPLVNFIVVSDAPHIDTFWSKYIRVNQASVPFFLSQESAHKLTLTLLTVIYLLSFCKMGITHIFSLESIDSKAKELLNRTSQNESASFEKNLSDLVAFQIKTAFESSQRCCYDFLIKEAKLLENLKFIKGVYFHERGDFGEMLLVQVFEELSGPGEAVSRMKLQGLLDNAVRSSSLKNCHPSQTDRLDVLLLDSTPGETGWERFCITVHLNQQIDVLLSPASTRFHMKIFHFLWRLKKTGYILNGAFTLISKNCRRTGSVYYPLCKKHMLIAGELMKLNSKISAHCYLNGVENAWGVLEAAIQNQKKSPSIEEIVSTYAMMLKMTLTSLFLLPNYDYVLCKIVDFFKLVSEDFKFLTKLLSELLGANERSQETMEEETPRDATQEVFTKIATVTRMENEVFWKFTNIRNDLEKTLKGLPEFSGSYLSLK